MSLLKQGSFLLEFRDLFNLGGANSVLKLRRYDNL